MIMLMLMLVFMLMFIVIVMINIRIRPRHRTSRRRRHQFRFGRDLDKEVLYARGERFFRLRGVEVVECWEEEAVEVLGVRGRVVGEVGEVWFWVWVEVRV